MDNIHVYMENCSLDKMTAVSSNKAFVEKTPFHFTPHVTLMPLVSLVGRVIARDTLTDTSDQVLLPSLRMSTEG